MMATAEPFIGVWINRSKTTVNAPTLTLTTQGGVYLSSFLAMFIRVAGGSAWNICRFLLHQYRSTSQQRDALYHQQQAILRNSPAPVDTVWDFTRLFWSWRNSGNRVRRRSMPIIFLGVLELALFWAAGLLLTPLKASSKDALVRNGTCGFIYAPDVGGWPDGPVD